VLLFPFCRVALKTRLVEQQRYHALGFAVLLSALITWKKFRLDLLIIDSSNECSTGGKCLATFFEGTALMRCWFQRNHVM
jgi:hypothetical protein